MLRVKKDGVPRLSHGTPLSTSGFLKKQEASANCEGFIAFS